MAVSVDSAELRSVGGCAINGHVCRWVPAAAAVPLNLIALGRGGSAGVHEAIWRLSVD